MMKISTSAITISGMARIMSIRRRNTGINAGHKANPRVDSSDSTMAASAPSRVEAAAMLIVSISEGRNFTIRPGSSAIFSPASARTSDGNWKMLPMPDQNPPALRLSASMKPDTISATNSAIMMPPYIRLRRTICM